VATIIHAVSAALMVEVSANAGVETKVAIENIAAVLTAARRGSASMMFPRPVIETRRLDASLSGLILLPPFQDAPLGADPESSSTRWVWIPGSMLRIAPE
jgi:hypothetical protein